MTPSVDPAAFEVPKPSIILVIATLLLYLLLVTEIAPWIGVDVSATAMAPVHVMLALALYAGSLAIVSRGSPLIWYDRGKFDRYLESLNPGWRNTAKSEAGPLADYLRALAWRGGTVAIAQQVGFVAGAAASMTFLERSWPLALLIYVVVGLTVGLIAKALLGAPDRAAMEARLAGREHGEVVGGTPG